MKISNPSFLKTKLLLLLKRLVTKLENTQNSDKRLNGEDWFISKVFSESDELTIFDIGANIGEYTRLVLKESKNRQVPVKVHLFEPSSVCFRQLNKYFGSRNTIFLNQSALSDKAGQKKLFFDQAGSSLASLHKRELANRGVVFNKFEQVRLVRLDSYLLKRTIKKIDLLKLDVEGHELAVLVGLGKYLNPKFIKYIQFEYGGCNFDSHTTLYQLYTILEKAGFKVCRLMPDSLEVLNYSKSLENFNYANFVALGKR